jgi:mono/diheme cytochrome c family protein
MRRSILIVLALALVSVAWPAGFAPAAEKISFNEQIRPIFVENCFGCHGADSAGRKADLRLDDRDAAVESGAIAPGDPDSSVALDRIFSDDPEEVMPPPSMKKVLTAEQKELLKRWIAEGAEYQPHWSFIPPTRPALPTVKNKDWVKNPIDAFILARLEKEGLAPAPEADRRTIARRLALDLTGLPPEPAVVDAFVADPHPDAYDRLVDAMLASLEWGEHRGRHWLDYARYADTHGIHFDNYREMWTYRQWVVNAFNRNMPFDQFTILQLAGDLVSHHGPNATPEQILDNRIASGFNRCNMTTNEGGVIAEEYLVLYTRDRTETTSAVWLGLTTGCAVCHDHKFDPLSQKEFYELSAFFNNTTQAAMDGNIHDTPPILPVPKPEDRPRFAVLEKELPVAKAAVDARKQAARPDFEAWVRQADASTVAKSLPQDTPLVDLPFSEGQGTTSRLKLIGKTSDLPLAAATTWQPGPNGAPALLLDGKAAEIAAAGDFEHDQPFSVTFWLRPPANDSAYAVVARMDDAQDHRGWDVFVQGRRVGMHIVHSWPDDAFRLMARGQLKADTWTLVSVTYDGSGRAEGVKIYYDGKLQERPNVENNKLKKSSIRTEASLTIGSRSPGQPAHGVGLAGLAIWGRGLSAGEVAGLSRAQVIADIVKLPVDERPKAADGIYDWWLTTLDSAFQQASTALTKLEAESAAIRKRGTIAHVMNEKTEMAKAYILDRGEYDKRKDEVKPDTPDMLPAFPADAPRNRLGLAQWLLLQEHPLTSRVTVNRFWQEVFGTGLVRSSGDFGITGELPSHPELLDWLAIEFIESGWDVKKLFKLMVSSAAYRQSAAATPEKLAKDNANRLLSRGPRFRMDAEMVRDCALAASGLLVKQIGGPSVKPYQPDGVWEAVSMGGNTNKYKRDTGENVYRRSMYWFWKRSAPPASMDIFNAPSRENCCVKRERTNTPLQALVTLNDPQFVEAARALADRALEIGGDTDESRIDFIAERLLARSLTTDEVAVVKQSLADLAAWYKDHPDEAKQLIVVGDSKPRAADPVQLASWTMLTNQLMNLDEVLCK